MSVKRTTVTSTFVELELDEGRTVRVTASDFTGSDALKGKKMATALQELIDEKVLVSSLPADDPDRTVDPTRSALFQSKEGSNTFLVSRSCVVQSVDWNGALGRWSVAIASPGSDGT